MSAPGHGERPDFEVSVDCDGPESVVRTLVLAGLDEIVTIDRPD